MNKPDFNPSSTEPVHVLTQRNVKRGCEEKFEVALHEFIACTLHAEGQLGVHVIRPVPESGSREYGILRRFRDSASRDRFYESQIFQEWDASVASLTEGEPKRQELSGLETWFTLPGQRSVVPPPRWKMALVTILGVYPASLLVPWLLYPLIGGLPQLLQSLLTAVGIVLLLTWVIMPALARVLKPWLGIAVLAVCMAVNSVPVLAHAESTASPPPYRQLRYDEDYSYLRDPSRRMDFWDTVKYVPIYSGGLIYLSLGGDARWRYEYFDNTRWGEGPQDNNGYLLQRYMLHADLHIGTHLRLFGQLKSGLEDGRTGGPRPPDKDKLDLHQAFLEIESDVGSDSSVVVRAGRQEMSFGSSRLVSVREGPNVRQCFDGARITVRAAGWSVDGFITRPVKTRADEFDDGTDFIRSFWGVYASVPLPAMPEGYADLYYLGLDRGDARFDQGTAHEHRHSVGTRIWGGRSTVDYNFEFVYQWGGFGSGEIQAWTAASDTGYTFGNIPFSPRLGLKANITSGDKNPDNPDLQTFNPLFPKGAYFNDMELIGPANLMDLHPSVDLHVMKPVTITLDWDFFWRESNRDGMYGNAVNLVRPGSESQARYIGSALSFKGEWRVDRHLTLVGVYTRFITGPFIRETGPGRDIDFLAGWAAYRF